MEIIATGAPIIEDLAPAAIGAARALWRARGTSMSGSRRTSGAGGAEVPVRLTGSNGVYAPSKVTKFKRRVPIAKKAASDQQVVTYIWHAGTPYNAKYGALGIANAVVEAQNGTADGTWGQYPMHMYDITGAPNVIRMNAEDGMQGLYGGRIVNPPVAYWTRYKINTNGNDANAVQTLSAIEHYRGEIVSATPSGQMGDNKWYVKYLKKPRGPVIYPDRTYDDTVPAGVKIEDDNQVVRSIVTPVVGPRPVHKSTFVKMCLVGCNDQPAIFDISLVRFKEDILCPDTQATTTILPGTLDTEAGRMANFAALFWHNFNLPYTHGPSAVPDYKVIKKGCQILAHRRVELSPKFSIENDTDMNHTYVKFNIKWNELRSYKWRVDADAGQTNSIPLWTGYGTKGPGYCTNIADIGNVSNIPSPKSRIFLIVRARSAMIHGNTWAASYTDNVSPGQTVVGDKVFGSASANIPSYDLTIENTFICDGKG